MGESKLILLYMILKEENYKKYFNFYYSDEKYSKMLLKPEYKTFRNNLHFGGQFLRIKNNNLVLSSVWTDHFIKTSKDYEDLKGFSEEEPYFNNEVVIFKFDNEEEAFYFQLKCSDFQPIGGIQNEKF